MTPPGPAWALGAGVYWLEELPAQGAVRRFRYRFTPAVVVRTAWLGLQGWDGLSWQQVQVVGETPTRYRIRALVATRLAGRRRTLAAGAVALVPRGALRFQEPAR